MLKKLAHALGLASILLSATSKALPIVEADAFSTGDNKAVLETSTGLVWMDFGVNSHLSYDHVRYLLSTDYAGWRLPTSSEAAHLWTSLFGSLPEWNQHNQELVSLTQDEYFDSVFAIFGNSTDSYFEARGQDGDVVDSWTARSMFAVFMDNGVSGFVSAHSPYDDTHESLAIYFDVMDADFSGLFGTLLVKDTANLPEPGSIGLVLLAFVVLVARRYHLI